MIIFFTTDTFQNNSKFVNPDWIRQFILCPVTDTIELLSVDNSNFNEAAGFFIKSRKLQANKFREFVTYTLTTSLVKIALKSGDNPLFHQKNKNTVEIRKFLQANAKLLLNKEKQKISRTTVLQFMNYFFTALPGLFENNAAEHRELIFKRFWRAEDLGTTVFHKKLTMAEFF
jgi:hypothetical protein